MSSSPIPSSSTLPPPTSPISPSPTPSLSLSPEIIIIGAGIAGSSLAYSLSQSGRQVLLIERDLSEPDRIVGELLQPGGVSALHQLGMSDCLNGIDATPVLGYCVVAGDRQVVVPYPDAQEEELTVEKDKGSAGEKENKVEDPRRKWVVHNHSGRKEGRSFHHGRFIQALRTKCRTSPNLSILEGTVRDLIYCPHTSRVLGVSVALKSSTSPPSITTNTTPSDALFSSSSTSFSSSTSTRNFYAPITIIADGCFSKFRTTKGARTPTPVTRSHFVGTVIKSSDLPMPHHGTVCLTPEGPVLLYQIGNEAKETRMLVDVKGKLPSQADGSLKNYIKDKYVPHLPLSVQQPVLDSLSNQRLRSMPNSFLPPSMQGLSHSLSGAILVGDAWNMRHPLTGGGMTVAFHDALLLTNILRPSEELPSGREGLENWDVISERLRRWFWERKKLAGTVNVLSMALYDLFGGADDDLAMLREGCFKYFELGGACISEPVGLLSALAPRPAILFYHFFSVALYTIYLLFKNGPPPPMSQSAPKGFSKYSLANVNGNGNGHSLDEDEKNEGGIIKKVAVMDQKPGWLDIPYLIYLSGKIFYTACVVFLPVMASEFRV